MKMFVSCFCCCCWLSSSESETSLAVVPVEVNEIFQVNSFDLNDGSEGDDIGHWVELFTTLAVLCPGTSADIPLLDMYVLNCSKSSYLFLLLGTDESVLLRRVNKSTVFD